MKRARAATVLVSVILTACGGESASSSTGTIQGVVLLGPVCPVETPESPCPDRPLPDITVRATRDGDVVATALTDADGRFSMSVDPGSYVLEAMLEPGGPGMSAKPVAVEVAPGANVHVRVAVDSGIRAPGVGAT